MSNALSPFRPTLFALLAAVLLAGCGDGGSDAPEITQEQIEALRIRSEAFQDRDAQQLSKDAEAMALAGELAAAHCAGCHGVGGTNPDRGVPNLATAEFDYGTTAADIRTTITQGRHSVMPPLGAQMGEVEIGALVALVQSFSGGEPPTTFAETAQELYQEHCVVCHGPDGKGDPKVGAPDLTDAHWTYGDSMMNIRLNITRGLDIQCPAQGDTLSGAEVELLTGWVLSIRQ